MSVRNRWKNAAERNFLQNCKNYNLFDKKINIFFLNTYASGIILDVMLICCRSFMTKLDASEVNTVSNILAFIESLTPPEAFEATAL